MAKTKRKSVVKLENDVISEDSDTKEETIEVVEEIKKYKVKINYVENNAIVFTLCGYSKRIYFDLPFKELEYLRENKNTYRNKILSIYYIGDITDITNVKILPLKNISDIGNKFK